MSLYGVELVVALAKQETVKNGENALVLTDHRKSSLLKVRFVMCYDQFRTERLPFRRISEKSFSFWDVNSYIYEQKIAAWIIIPICRR